MLKIRDLGINFIPETGQPEENGAGGAYAMAGQKKKPCGAKTACKGHTACPKISECPPPQSTLTPRPIKPTKKAGELTPEAVELLQARLEQRMADGAPGSHELS